MKASKHLEKGQKPTISPQPKKKTQKTAPHLQGHETWSDEAVLAVEFHHRHYLQKFSQPTCRHHKWPTWKRAKEATSFSKASWERHENTASLPKTKSKVKPLKMGFNPKKERRSFLQKPSSFRDYKNLLVSGRDCCFVMFVKLTHENFAKSLKIVNILSGKVSNSAFSWHKFGISKQFSKVSGGLRVCQCSHSNSKNVDENK